MVGVEAPVYGTGEGLGGQLDVGGACSRRRRRWRGAVRRELDLEPPVRFSGANGDRCGGSGGGLSGAAGDQLEAVDEVGCDGIGDRGGTFEGAVDVPGVEPVLVEPEADETLEVDADRAHREGEPVTFGIAQPVERGKELGVGGVPVVDLCPWSLGVPLVPRPRRELI